MSLHGLVGVGSELKEEGFEALAVSQPTGEIGAFLRLNHSGPSDAPLKETTPPPPSGPRYATKGSVRVDFALTK